MSAVVNVEKAPGDEPGAGSVQQGMKLIQDSI